MSDSTRWTIIRGAAEGKPLDRAEFARRYAAIVRAYLGARWRHSPLLREIDDAAQEVFVTCFNVPQCPAEKMLCGAFPERIISITATAPDGFA